MHPTSHLLPRRRARGLSLPLLAALAALALRLAWLPVPLAYAASLNVTGTADIIANDSVCTLREAIINANTDSQAGSTDCTQGNGADEIAIPAGTYTLTITGKGEDAAVTGDLDLTQSVTMVGEGSASSIIQAGTDFGSSIDRVFQVLSGVSAEFRDVTIGRGNASSSDNGGGIYNAGNTTVNASTLSNNVALAGGGVYNDSGGTLMISSSTLSPNSSVLYGGGIYNAGALTISSSTLSYNYTSTGGGIYNAGTLTIGSSTLSSNYTSTSDGGGIYNDSGGTLMISSSTLSDNNAGAFRGGGIYSVGTVTISRSTLWNNNASGGGGGIYNASTVTISSSTLSDNNAGAFGNGGGLYNAGSLTISSSTLSNNNASTGGSIYNDAGRTVQAKDSIIANTLSGGNCDNLGTLSISGTNLSTDSSCLNFTQVTQAQLNLGPLQNNGGPTHTHALLSGSVAIDAAADCTDATGAPITEDQRGVARPHGAACDVGAFEASFPAFTSGAPAVGTYGAAYSHTFSTSSPAPIYSVLGGSLPPGLSLDGTTGVLSGTATQAGNFSFIVRASNSGGSADQKVDLTINKAPLRITADDKSKDYGAATPTLTASYSGLVNGDTPASLDTSLTLTTDATATSPAGTYPIVASGAADANYTITFVNGTLTVSAPSLFWVYLPQVGLGELTVTEPNPPQLRAQTAMDLQARPIHLIK